MVWSLVDNRACFAFYPGGTSSLKRTPVPLAAYSSRTVYIFLHITPELGQTWIKSKLMSSVYKTTHQFFSSFFMVFTIYLLSKGKMCFYIFRSATYGESTNNLALVCTSHWLRNPSERSCFQAELKFIPSLFLDWQPCHSSVMVLCSSRGWFPNR